MTDREGAIEQVATEIETDLTLLGATAIEDKLQDGVPETIANLILGGVKVWVLTGDKQETAINIGYSCQVFVINFEMNCTEKILFYIRLYLLTHSQLLTDPTGAEHMIINTSTLDETRKRITELNDKNSRLSKEEKERMSLIIDGASLIHALKHDLRRAFIELCCTCKTVICCRVSPIQVRESFAHCQMSS